MPGLAAWVAVVWVRGLRPGNFLASRDCNARCYSPHGFALSVTAVTALRDESPLWAW